SRAPGGAAPRPGEAVRPAPGTVRADAARPGVEPDTFPIGTWRRHGGKSGHATPGAAISPGFQVPRPGTASAHGGAMSNVPEPSPRPPRLLDQVRAAIRLRHHSPRTEKAYCAWIRRYIRFHGCDHPRELGPEAIEAFLTHLATEDHVSASTQNQA